MGFEPKYATIVDLFEAATSAHAERPLFGSKWPAGWTWLSYGEFGCAVRACRKGLLARGLSRGDRVALISNNRVEWALTSFAALSLGAVVVPMYEAQLASDWEYILRDCGARVLVVSTRSIYERVASFPLRISSLQHVVGMELDASDASSFANLQAARDIDDGPTSVSSGDVAFLIYTSGTTGHPKGVELTHGNVASNVSAVGEMFDVQLDDRSLSFLPWAHSFGLTAELLTLLSKGAQIGINSAVERLVDELSEVRPTVLIAVPRVFNRIYAGVHKQMATKAAPIRSLFGAGLAARAKQERGKALTWTEKLLLATAERLVFGKVRGRFGGRLRYAISGGAALSREVGAFIDALGITVYEGYGLSECSPIAAANSPSGRRMGSVGKAIPGCRIAIDRADTDDASGVGEVIVYGPNVMRGYHGLPEETAKALTTDGGLRTGDMGYVDDDGFLFITGRLKEQYKLENGKYVVPSPIEETLKLSPWIANAFVHGENRPYNVAILVADMESVRAWATEREFGERSDSELLEHPRVQEQMRAEIDRVTEGMKGYERVERFATVSEDFTTANGMLTPSLKLKRRAVIAVHGELVESLYTRG